MGAGIEPAPPGDEPGDFPLVHPTKAPVVASRRLFAERQGDASGISHQLYNIGFITFSHLKLLNINQRLVDDNLMF